VELAGVVLEEARDPPALEEKSHGVKVADVDQHYRVGCRDRRVIERPENRRRTGIHDEERRCA